jgi:hypothetical protein
VPNVPIVPNLMHTVAISENYINNCAKARGPRLIPVIVAEIGFFGINARGRRKE